ncbi:pitrilysin family protein [uncultured Streptomyces sp.]|uniref:M16 family metallopeptidase n=1 Tax=uncultured Streptomyces sp. TaxID=174707 RepID=UPI002626B62A|nr:pitrilysin family protein [uncultured Streptomyces sp.]
MTGPIPGSLRLDNGMRVLLEPLPGTHVVAVCLHVGTGFRNEPVAGAAHLLEHVLVQGASSSRPLTDAVLAMGGTMNARTAADYTQFTSVLPADGLEIGLRIEHERLADPDLSTGHVTAQKDVVLAEIRRNILQRPHGGLVLFDLPDLLHDSWENRHNGYGDAEALAGLDPEALSAFHDRSYAPENVHLVLAGDFDPDRARELVARTLGTLPARPTWRRAPVGEGPSTAPRRRERADRVAPAGRTVCGFRSPSPSADPAGHLATVLLSELVETLGEACDCHTPADRPWGGFRARVSRTGNPFDVAHDTLFSVDFPHPADASPDEAEACLRRLLGRVAEARIPIAEPLAVIRRQTALHLHAELDSVTSRASWLAVGAAVHGDPHHLAGLPDALRAVPDEEVARWAGHYANRPGARITSLPAPAGLPAGPVPSGAVR